MVANEENRDTTVSTNSSMVREKQTPWYMFDPRKSKCLPYWDAIIAVRACRRSDPITQSSE